MTPTPDTTPKNAWTRFWFTPTDPTTLGFMRIVTGLLILYVHSVYCLDLYAYFGKHGWYSLSEVDKERHESPTVIPPMFGPEAWQDYVPNGRVPIFPHRLEAVMKFIRKVDADPAVRKGQLAYLIRIQNEVLKSSQPPTTVNPATGLYAMNMSAHLPRNYAAVPNEALDYLNSFYTAEKVRGPQLDAFVNPALRSPKDRVPPAFLNDLDQTGPNSREAVRHEIEQFLAVLATDSTQRKYVIDHLVETGFQNRQSLLEFLLNLPADAAERERQTAYLEKWGAEEHKAYSRGNATFSLWYHISDPTEMAVAHGVILVVMVLFTIGLFTRVTSVLTWLAAVGYIQRTQQVLFGMDTMMNLLLIYLMIGSSGAALSVDRLIARYRASRNSLRRTGGLDGPTRAFLAAPPKSVVAGFALRLVQFHFCIIYLAAGMSKLQGGSWWNTNAFWDTMANPEFTLIHFRWYEDWLRFMVQHRIVYACMAGFMVVFTFVMELGLPFLIWGRLRPYYVVLSALFHFGISLSMGLNLFGLFMMTLVLSFVPGAAIRSQLRGGPNLPRGRIDFDPKQEAHEKAAAAAVMADTDGQLDLAPGEGKAYAVTVNGQESTGAAVPTALFGTLTLLKLARVLKWVPGVKGLFGVK
ncbi:HTTM domain-containing protein [Limnoglobus roseus]|uniref:HTTM-like domain-containing protein n=1 Tax=Limnoglobus roseus TaxID=2598579 RepID=A0A5C1A6W6_9BACT|nr:HTTM domain-containing protein [Limnoglobus roseus]QEL13736.1 hypothetical protein PX52LOC_00594 [Limnoglobus roseus]